MKAGAIIAILFVCLRLTCQNLVPNCDLREISSCPTGSGQLSKAAGWYSPGTGTSDFCHTCGETDVNVPHNMWGTQYAFSGESYAHIICYYPTYGNDYREYMQTEIACPLKEGKDYKVTFTVSCTDKSRYAVDGIGLCFSIQPIIQNGNNVISLGIPAHISLGAGVPVFDKLGWTLVSGIYHASGGEKYITIGNFTPEDGLTIFEFSGVSTTYSSLYVDMISVTPVDPWFDLGSDTTLCFGESMLIDATLDCSAIYAWEDGSTDPLRLIASPGTYSLYATIGCGSVYDEITVNWLPEPELPLPPDTIICNGTMIVLDAGEGYFDYKWQDGSKASYVIAEEAGIYWVEVVNEIGCTYRDSVIIEALEEPGIFLGDDSILCMGDTILLVAGMEANHTEYLWSDGTTGNQHHVDKEGAYWVKASNPCGFSYDTIYIGYHNCEVRVWMPSAFTPNNDGKNDLFKASGDNITKFRLQIYDRWGKLIFETKDIGAGWDGKCNGLACPCDVYIWSVYYESDQGEWPIRDNIRGSFILLK